MPKKKRTTLSDAEIVKFDLNQESEKRRQLQINELKLKKEILALKKQVLNGRIELLQQEEKALAELMVKKLQEHGKERTTHKEFVEQLKLELGIESDKFGFDPISGEVIIE